MDTGTTTTNIGTETVIAYTFSDQLRAEFDPAIGVMWLRWSPKPRPCFNPALLDACNMFADFMKSTCGVLEHRGQKHSINSCVLSSDVPGIFNLGGDLDLFGALIEKRDALGLMKYGRACVDAVFHNYSGYDLPITTISLVQGKCLGGGFEAALSSNVVIAERSSQFGFPEILFSLFPGMGAMSFLIRRSNDRLATAMTNTGTLYGAEEMLAEGVIDMMVEDGEGPAAVSHYLRKREPSQRHVFKMRKIVRPLARKELDAIVALWVETALTIQPRDLKLMGALVARQSRLK